MVQKSKEESSEMKAHVLLILLSAILAFGSLGCGKKEEAPTTAPETPAVGKTVDPATAGTISGIVKFTGTPPPPVRLRMDADAACARLHPGPVTVREVETGANGGLARVVVYVKEGLEGYTFPPATEAIELDQEGCMYQPRVLAVRTGQPIEIVNSDDTTHNIHPIPKVNREWNRSQPPKGEKIVDSFARQEVAIPVKCNIHPWMQAYIAVIAHPYFQVTGEAGTFELKNLPPGTYTLEAWHEKLGTTTQQVTLGPNETKTVEFVFQGS